MAYNRVSLKKSKATPKAKSAKVLLIPYDSIATFPARAEDEVLVEGDITLKEGEQAIEMEVTATTIARNDVYEGDPDEEGFNQNIAFSFPGNGLAYDRFVQKWNGKPFIVISTECGDTLGTRAHGWNCNPVFFVPEETDNNEAKKTMMTFSQHQRSIWKAAYYQGDLPASAPYEGGSGSNSGGV